MNDLDNTQELTVLSLCTGYGGLRMLIMARSEKASVFGLCVEFQIINCIIAAVAVYVVNVMFWRYCAMATFPYFTMQELAFTAGATIVAIRSAGILLALKHNKRQGLYATQLKVTSMKTIIYSLPAYSKRIAYLSQAKVLLVEIVHSVCCWKIGLATHNSPFRNTTKIIERLTGVK